MIIRRFTDDAPLTDAKGKPLATAPKVDDLALQGDPRELATA